MSLMGSYLPLPATFQNKQETCSNKSFEREAYRSFIYGLRQIWRMLFSNPRTIIKSFAPVLIRDADDTDYPYSGDVPDFKKRPHWKMYYFVGHTHDDIKVRTRTYPAYREADYQKWKY